MTTNYVLHTPPGYTKQPLAGLTEWLAALRSGEYKQGQHYLRDNDNRFCCLGVKCDLEYLTEGLRFNGTYYNSTSCYRGLSALSGGGDLPGGVKVYLPKHDVRINALSTLNDYDVPFTDIANIIEALWTDQPTINSL